jgi:hypothetical protein
MPEDRAELLHNEIEHETSELECGTDTTPPVSTPYPDAKTVAKMEAPEKRRC